MIPDYNRVVIGNVSSITPDQLKQLKDNQMYLDWHYDKMPKGVIAKKNGTAHVQTGGSSNVNVLLISGFPIFAGRIYRIVLNNNGVGEVNNDNTFGGQIKIIDLHGNRVATYFLFGDHENTGNPGIGSFIPVEGIYLSTETNPSFQFQALIDIPATYSYTPYNGSGVAQSPHSNTGGDWIYASTDVAISYQLIIEDMGAYSNDPWQYITGS